MNIEFEIHNLQLTIVVCLLFDSLIRFHRMESKTNTENSIMGRVSTFNFKLKLLTRKWKRDEKKDKKVDDQKLQKKTKINKLNNKQTNRYIAYK